MRIALFHNLPSGGAKRHTREQARELSERGHDIVELCPQTAEIELCSLTPFTSARQVFPFTVPPLAPRRPGVTPYLHLAQALMLLRRLDRLHATIATVIDRGGFDVVLAQDCRLAMTPSILRHLRTRSAYFCHHGFDHWDAPAAANRTIRERLTRRWYAAPRWLGSVAWQRSERRSADAADALLSASRFAADLIRDRYGRGAETVGGGVDPQRFASSDEPAANYVLSVGELTPRKQHRFVVAALARIAPARRPPLLIAANLTNADEAAALRADADAGGVALHIERFTDDAALAQAYRGARAFVYAPRGEMLGLACLEAMSCGVPVVAVREGGVAETVLDGVTGWLCERDPAAFAARLEDLLADEARRRRMGAAGAAHVRRAWTWSAMGDRLEAALAREVEHRR